MERKNEIRLAHMAEKRRRKIEETRRASEAKKIRIAEALAK